MGLTDHRKQWGYRIRGNVQDCTDAIEQAFSPKGGTALRRGTFHVGRTSTEHGIHIDALYGGRRGLGAASTNLHRGMGQLEHQAEGSRIAIDIEDTGGDVYCVCTARLAESSTVFRLTLAAGVLRAYVQGIEKFLRRVDPNLTASKS